MAGQSAYPEDTEILRVPLALAMVKLLQNLPQKTLEQSLPGYVIFPSIKIICHFNGVHYCISHPSLHSRYCTCTI